MKIFAIKDNKALSLSRYFFAPTIGLAIRTISDAIQNTNDALHHHTVDFDLMELVEFDDISGDSAEPCHARIISNCADLVAQLPPSDIRSGAINDAPHPPAVHIIND